LQCASSVLEMPPNTTQQGDASAFLTLSGWDATAVLTGTSCGWIAQSLPQSVRGQRSVGPNFRSFSRGVCMASSQSALKLPLLREKKRLKAIKTLLRNTFATLQAPLNFIFPRVKRETADVAVESVEDMSYLIDACGLNIDDVYKQVRGKSATSLALSGQHQVLQAIRARVMSDSKPGARGDGLKIGLAIEGGGMRGCVSAGMAVCLDKLGLSDCFDVVYGSSAGALVGGYFVSGGWHVCVCVCVCDEVFWSFIWARISDDIWVKESYDVHLRKIK